MAYDLLIRGGTLIDPAAGIHERRDVAFQNGRVAATAPRIDAAAAETLDASGRYVTPGWIDLHVHVFAGVSHFGIPPDEHCVAKGVTTAVDAGSAGADTFAGFRRYIIDVSETRLYAFCNISAQGMLNAQVGELEELRFADVQRAVATCEANRDVILGVKVRLTRNLVGDNGLKPLHLAREAADAAGMPIMVHPQDAHGDLDEILAVMRRGDIMTHTFHGMRGGILDEDGRIRRCVRQAAERGVVFDVGHGAGSFSWRIVEQAMAQEFAPHTISTDLHVYNVNGPVFDQATTLAKFMHLGLSLEEALARTTATPADALGGGLERVLGTLAVGAAGDAVVCELEEGPITLTDSRGETREGSVRLRVREVIRGGRIYRAPASAPHPHGASPLDRV